MLDFTAIDFETANPSAASACSVGLAKVRGGKIVDIAPDRQHPVAGLLAPVTDGSGKVQFMLVMAGFHSSMSGEQILAAGDKLAAACRRISSFLASR